MSSILKVDQLQDSGGNAIITSDGSGNITTGTGMGKVLQVVSTTKTDTFATTATSFTDVTGLSVTITPSATSSKIYIIGSIFGSGGVTANNAVFRMLRDATVINAGNSAGSRTLGMGVAQSANDNFNGEFIPIAFLDSPSTTSATTYKVQTFSNSGANASCVNRPFSDTDANYVLRGTSTITAYEI